MKKTIYKYTITGILFGFCFPIGAYIIEEIIIGHHLTFECIRLLHINNPLVFMIDTAPIFLGIVAYLAGVNMHKAEQLNLKLSKTTDELIKSKEEINNMLKIAEQENTNLKESSFKDSLTGLGNQEALILDIANKENVLLCLVDINYFREINELYGYETGDEILKCFAERLKEMRLDCYRIENDEFVILNYVIANELEIDIMARYIHENISEEEFGCYTKETYLTATLGFSTHIGIVEKDENKYIGKKLLANARFAMKHAKNHRKIYSVFDEKLSVKREEQDNLLWTFKLKKAIKNSNIINYFQPIINNKTMKEEKYESLIRLIDESGTVLSPFLFLEASKKCRLYNSLTRIVFQNTLSALENCNSEISINISINDINDYVTKKFIYDILASVKTPSNVVLELLESEGIENYDEVKEFIKVVKEIGCKIAIDDFGSGYSNFDHLFKLDIDYIKIDASIIKNINVDKNSEMIAETIVSFARKKGIKTIAEFVHSKEVFEKVAELGIDYSQGFYFGEPRSKI